MIALDDIRRNFRGRIALNETIAPYTTFRIGGPADIYLEPLDRDDALALVRHLERNDVPYFLMGNGSNILVSDDGVRGAVVNLEKGFNFLEFHEPAVHAGAGVKLARFVDFCIQHGRRGAEMLSGIPGTLGGAIIMNAGAYGGEISDYMLSVEMIRDGELVRIDKSEGGFAYRTSNLRGSVVLEATFEFPEGLPDEMKTIRRETLLKRNASQPVRWPNAGSIFKNPPGDYAARLIQECGLKGRRVGGAEIAELHANFIINTDGATAADVIALMKIARDEVRDRFGVELEPEIKFVGFESDPMS